MTSKELTAYYVKWRETSYMLSGLAKMSNEVYAKGKRVVTAEGRKGTVERTRLHAEIFDDGYVCLGLFVTVLFDDGTIEKLVDHKIKIIDDE